LNESLLTSPFYNSFILIIPLLHAALVDLLFLRRKIKGKKREKEKRKKEKEEGVSRLLSLTKMNILALWSK
jgi:hypothetical protein